MTVARAYLALASVVCLVALVNALLDWPTFVHPSWVSSQALAATGVLALGAGYGATFWWLGVRPWADAVALTLAVGGVVVGPFTGPVRMTLQIVFLVAVLNVTGRRLQPLDQRVLGHRVRR